MAGSSSVCSVLFQGPNDFQETRAGGYIYRGEAATFHEWEFRIKVRSAAKTGDAYADAAAKIVDALRDDAFVVAQEVGVETVMKEGGLDALVKAMKEMVFPLSTHEAKELFRQFCKQSGPLACQSGESMKQYTSRRSRCWNLL